MSFKFHIVEEPWNARTKLLLIEKSGQEIFALYRAADGSIRRTPLREHTSEEPEAFLTLDSDLARHIFPALIEALSKNGFERPSESKIAGLYEAQTAHLNDMRLIAGLVPNVIIERPRR